MNKWRVTQPILGMIDEAAEKADYYPAYAKDHKPAKRAVEEEVDWEEHTPSIA